MNKSIALKIKFKLVKEGKNGIILVFLFIVHALILVLPYYLRGYNVPVGWDTVQYICTLRFIEDDGLYSVLKSAPISFYSLFEYLIFTLSRIPFIELEKILPICLGSFLSLINYLTIRKLYDSKKLTLLVVIFSILNVNAMRLVTDLHRNLFCLILVQIALFLILPDYLKNPSSYKAMALVSLLVMGGLSQVETFFVGMVTIFLLFISYLLKRYYFQAKRIFLVIITSIVLYVLVMSSFLLRLIESHMIFNTAVTFSLEFFAKQGDYLRYLGGPLLPLYLIGLCLSMVKCSKKHEDLLSIIFFWNAFLLISSLAPWLGLKIYGWRFLLITTVPITSTIGLTIFSKFRITLKFIKPPLQTKNPSIAIKLIFILLLSYFALTHYVNNTSNYFRPYISNEVYMKLTWISKNIDGTKPAIMIIYFNHRQWTLGNALFYRQWCGAILGTKSIVYFGNLYFIKYGVPTPSLYSEMNRTSYAFWDSLSDWQKKILKNSTIYLIDDWYKLSALDKNYLDSLDENQGIYLLRSNGSIVQSAYRDYYNRTENSYGRADAWSKNWSQSEYILESYEDPFDERFKNPSYFQVSFLIPMLDDVNYTLRIHWFDYIPRYAPITVSLDSKKITSLTYKGTNQPAIVEVFLPKVALGYHIISIEISGHQDKVHIISLDFVEVIPI